MFYISSETVDTLYFSSLHVPEVKSCRLPKKKKKETTSDLCASSMDSLKSFTYFRCNTRLLLCLVEYVQSYQSKWLSISLENKIYIKNVK